MVQDMIGNIIGGLGSALLSGVFGLRQSRDQTNAIAASNAANAYQNRKSRQFSRNEAEKARRWQSNADRKAFRQAASFGRHQAGLDRRLQREFAKRSAGWQFADLMAAADSAGVHRAAALGAAAGTPYSPVGGIGLPGQGSAAQAATPGFVGDTPVTSDFNMGDVIGGGLNAATSWFAEERRQVARQAQEAAALTVQQADLASLEELRSAQIGLLKAQTAQAAMSAELAAATSRTSIKRARDATNGAQNIYETYVDDSGTPVTVPVGPDLDEIIAGAGIAGAAAVKGLLRGSGGTTRKRGTIRATRRGSAASLKPKTGTRSGRNKPRN
jgi:hypothetical protein